MRGQPKTFVPDRGSGDSIGVSLVLLVALLTTFALMAIVMGRNHSWTEKIMARLPSPGPAWSMAADPSISHQLRVTGVSAWNLVLSDLTPALVAEAEVVNDSLVPVRHVMVHARAYTRDRVVAEATTACGKPLSSRLLGRLGREELRAHAELVPVIRTPPSERVACQVTFPGLEPGIDEVVFTIASVEPLPGHRPPSFSPSE